MKNPSGNFHRNFLWPVITALGAVLLSFKTFPPDQLFSPHPIAFGDYTHHFYKSYATGNFLSVFGRLSGYDPFFMAGYPGGGVMSLDGKLWELLYWPLSFLVAPPVAFKLLVFLSFLICPLIVYFISRNFEFDQKSSLWTVWGWGLVWFLDPTVFNFWKIGLYSWLPASLLGILASSLFYRLWREDEENKRVVFALALVFPIAVWMHVFSALIVIVSIGVGFFISTAAQRRKLFSFWPVAVVWFISALPLLLPFLDRLNEFVSVSTLSRGVFQAGFKDLVSELLFDRSGLLLFQHGTHRLKLAVFLMAGWGVGMDGNRDRARFVGVFSLILGLLAYLGSGFPLIKETQSYRFVIPLMALLLPYAVFGAWEFFKQLKRLIPDFKFLNILLLVLLVPMFARLGGALKHVGLQAALSVEEQALLRAVREYTDRSGRILFPIDTGSIFPASLPYYTRREMVGGFFREVYTRHNFTNALNRPDILFGRPLASIDENRMRKYLSWYNIGWVIASRAEYYLSHPRLFQELVKVGKWTLFKVSLKKSFFMQGSGEITADYNRIKIRNASSGKIVLKYHWDPDLIITPPMKILRYDLKEEPVGFIEISDNSFSEFVLSVP